MRPIFASTNRRFCCPPSSPGSILHLFCSLSPPATPSPCPILRSTWRDPAPLMRPVRADTHLPVLDSSLSQCTYEISWKRVNIKSPWHQSKSTFSSNPAFPGTHTVLAVATTDIPPFHPNSPRITPGATMLRKAHRIRPHPITPINRLVYEIGSPLPSNRTNHPLPTLARWRHTTGGIPPTVDNVLR
jgi:hypothetical protein